MRFSTKLSTTFPRTGTITEIVGHSDVTFPTPNCLLFTQFGAVPFLTNDIVEGIANAPRITFAALNFMREKLKVFQRFGKGLAEFSGLKNFPVFLFQNDPTEAFLTRAVERTVISIWAVGGRLPVTMPQYADCVVNALPAAYQLPVDNETSFPDLVTPGKKRCQKAVQRTSDYSKEIKILCQKDEKLEKIPFFVSIAGGNDLDQRLRGIANTDFTNASGVVLDGFFIDRLDASGKPLRELIGYGKSDQLISEVFDLVDKISHQLPPELPRLMTRVWQPDEVVQAASAGVDLFDGSLPYRLSRSGLAWIYPTVNKKQQPWIKFPFSDCDLTGRVYQQPIQPNSCSCSVCQRHSRVYISHLHSVNEMLAPILLMIHNSSRCYQFFEDFRNAIETGKLEDFRDSIKHHHFPEELTKVDLTAASLRNDNDDT